jgi:hypothetical protein
MDLRNMSVASLLPSTSVYLDITKIKSDLTGSIKPDEQRLVWLKDKPRTIELLDSCLRKSFNIPDKSKMVFSLYLPPDPKDKTLSIKKTPHKLISRVLISTIGESPEIVLGHKTEKLKMKSGEAYNLPFPVNSMMNIVFDNSRTLIIPARKGFRQQKMTKKVENRYILMFDYVYTDEIKEAINELTGKDEELRGYDRPDSGDTEQGSESKMQDDVVPDHDD